MKTNAVTMKKHAFLSGLALMAAVSGCGAPSVGNTAPPTIPSSDVTQACCTIGELTSCAGSAVLVQWNDEYWTDRPDEDDAGPCQHGESCSAYAATDGSLEPLGNGRCE